MSALEVRRLTAFGRQVWGDADRDLKLLKAIDATLDALDVEQERVNQLNSAAEFFIEKVQNANARIDTTGELVPLFERARDLVGQAYEVLCARHNSAVEDPKLRVDDGIADAYFELMQSTCDLHNSLNKLAWLIGENDADHDVVHAEPFYNAEDLFKALGV